MIRISIVAWLAFVARVAGAVYDVGPGKQYETIGEAPWATLEPGDTVRIFWRSTPYKEKWVICRQGTADAPIRIIGISRRGRRPAIDGSDAVTAPGLNYWSEQRGVIKIGGANTPADTMPRHIIIENLDIRNAHTPYTFRADDGSTQAYSANAAAIYLEKGENITLRNNILRDSGNGLFVASSQTSVSRDILVEKNYIHSNGNVNSIFEHNSYTAAVGITFQYNRYGPLLEGAGGNNLKDRSAGLVVRNNWIESGNRQLDLVDGEDSSIIVTDPRYRETHVHGNILIEPEGAGNRQIVHYGGDSGNTAAYRQGTLYFYNNTIVSYRTDRTTLFRLSTNQERCDARNNVFYTTQPGTTLSLVDSSGQLDLYNNWVKSGWVNTFGTLAGTITVSGAFVEESAPGFANEEARNFRPSSASPLRDRGTVLHSLVLPDRDVVRQYVKHRKSRRRPKDEVLDIGAFEAR